MKPIFIFLMIVGTALQAQVSQNMVFRSNWDDNSLPNRSGFNYSDLWGYAADDREYAILGASNATIFIDITNPVNPIEVTRITAGGNASGLSLWRDYKTFGNYAYGVADETSATHPSGLQIFDLSDLPNSVTMVYHSSAFFAEAHSIFIDEAAGRLYAVGTDTRSNGVIILDLKTTPANPTLMVSTNLPGSYVHDLFVQGDTAYCSHGNNGLYIYDMSNTASIATIGAMPNYPGQGYNHSSALTEDGNTLIFADENKNQPIRLLDVSDFSNLSIVSSFKSTLEAPTATNSIAHNPFIKGQWVFISYYHDGLQVYDISDPNNPFRAGYYDTDPSNSNYNGSAGAWGIYPFLPSGNIIGSDIRNGLFVVSPTIGGLALGTVTLSATAQARGILLDWESDTEDFVSFQVEKSTDGTQFETFEEVSYQSGTQRYATLDTNPHSGSTLYRLKMTDPDGGIHFSNKVEASYDFSQQTMELFPNPITSDQPFYIRAASDREAIMRFDLYDLHGKRAFTQTYTLAPGMQVIQPQVNLPSGTYFAKMVNGLETEIVKVLVQ